MRPLIHIALWLLAVGLCPAASGRVSAAPVSDSVRLARGLDLFGQDRFEEAREELYISARSDDAYTRAESFLYLNALETELGNHAAARAHLERYHAETVRLMRQADEARLQMDRRMVRLARRGNLLVGGFVFVGLVVIGVWVYFTRRQPPQGPQANATQTRVASQLVHRPPGEVWGDETIFAEALEFSQTEIYAELVELSAQRPDRNAKVLSLARQEVLDDELEAAFPEFRRRLRSEFPALTAGDVKLCCLSLVPLSSFGRALAFGSTETNIIKQRKHLIKKKLCVDPSGPAVFEFVFAVRE